MKSWDDIFSNFQTLLYIDVNDLNERLNSRALPINAFSIEPVALDMYINATIELF